MVSPLPLASLADITSWPLRLHTSAASASEPSSASAASCFAHHLHDDELLCVLAFLTLPDLASMVCCCRRWNAVARKERCRAACLLIHRGVPTKALSAFATSSLAHHWTSVDALAASTALDLRALCRLPNLTKLSCATNRFDLPPHRQRDTPAVELIVQLRDAMPQRLQELHLWHRDRKSATVLDLLVDARLPQLTSLSLKLKWGAGIDFLALLRLPCLRTFALYCPPNLAQVAVIKQMSSLRTLECARGDWYPHMLRELCKLPHQLGQLEYLRMDGLIVYEEIMRELTTLPSLRRFDPRSIDPDAVSMLVHFPCVETLKLHFRYVSTLPQLTELPAILQQCSRVTSLDLSIRLLEDDEFDAPAWWHRLFLDGVPQLTVLAVRYDLHIGLLAALSSTGCLPQLCNLKLTHFADDQLSELLSELAHPTLQRLCILLAPGATSADGVVEDRDAQQQYNGALLHTARLPKLSKCDFFRMGKWSE
jgi:hypothetical protein